MRTRKITHTQLRSLIAQQVRRLHESSADSDFGPPDGYAKSRELTGMSAVRAREEAVTGHESWQRVVDLIEQIIDDTGADVDDVVGALVSQFDLSPVR